MINPKQDNIKPIEIVGRFGLISGSIEIKPR